MNVGADAGVGEEDGEGFGEGGWAAGAVGSDVAVSAAGAVGAIGAVDAICADGSEGEDWRAAAWGAGVGIGRGSRLEALLGGAGLVVRMW